MASLSTRTVVYKGQFDPCQLWEYYTELRRPELETHLCIVHTRWVVRSQCKLILIQVLYKHVPLLGEGPPHEIHCSQRRDQHLAGKSEPHESQRRGNKVVLDCEIHPRTFQVMSSSLLGDLSPLYPVVEKDLSDSGSIDCSIEFLMQAGGRLAFLFFNRANKLWIETGHCPRR